jgi:nucleotide-binding universal stress UspA family protein
MMAFRRPRAVSSGTASVRAAATPRKAIQAATGLLAGQDSGPVLVGVDGRARDWDALEWAAAEAVARQCTLRVVHVINWPSLMPESSGGVSAAQWDAGAQQAAELALSEAARRVRIIAAALRVTTHLQAGATAAAIVQESDRDALIVVGRGREAGRLRFPDVAVRMRHVTGPAGPALVAESAAAALVVLGSRARGRQHRTRSGSPVRDVLRAARSPVAIARTPDTERGYRRPGAG